MNSDERFNYSYSAPNERERREIESIRKQYTDVPEKEDKLERLRKLNKRVTVPPLVIGIAIGTTGTLIMGLGMSLVQVWNIIVWGVTVGVLGAAIAAVAYPIYKALVRRNKKKYGQQIIDLSDELLNLQENERK